METFQRRRCRILEWPHVDLVLSGVIRLIREPASVGRQRRIQLVVRRNQQRRHDGRDGPVRSNADRSSCPCTSDHESCIAAREYLRYLEKIGPVDQTCGARAVGRNGKNVERAAPGSTRNRRRVRRRSRAGIMSSAGESVSGIMLRRCRSHTGCCGAFRRRPQRCSGHQAKRVDRSSRLPARRPVPRDPRDRPSSASAARHDPRTSRRR